MGAVQVVQGAMIAFVVWQFVSVERARVVQTRDAQDALKKEIAYQLTVIPN